MSLAISLSVYHLYLHLKVAIFKPRKYLKVAIGLHMLLSYLKVVIFQQLRKWTSRTTSVLKNCDFEDLAAKVDFRNFRNEKLQFSQVDFTYYFRT